MYKWLELEQQWTSTPITVKPTFMAVSGRPFTKTKLGEELGIAAMLVES